MNGPAFATQTVPAPVQQRMAPVPPRPAAPQRPSIAKPDGEGQALRFLTYLRLHWLTILFAGALLGTGLAYLAWVLMPPKYESYALFQVASMPSSVTGTDPTRSKTDFATYLKTQASLFKYEFVYAAALRDSKLGDLPTVRAEKDPFKYFDEKLLVETKEGSEIVRLSLLGDNPDDIRKIVDGIKEAYLREVIMKEKDTKNELRLELQKAKADLENLMKSKSASKPELAGAIGGGGEVIPKIPDAAPLGAVPLADPDAVKRARFPLLVQKVAKLENDLPNYDLQVAARKADIAAGEKALKALADMPIAPESVDAAKKDPEYMEKDAQAKYYRREEGFLRNTLGNAESPRVLAMGSKAKAAEEEAQKMLNEKAKALELVRRKPMFQEINQSMNLAVRDITLIGEQKKIAEMQLAAGRKELSEMPAAPEVKTAQQLKASEYKDAAVTDYTTHEKLYERVTSQLIATEYDLKLPPRVKVIQPATTPTLKDSKKQIFAAVFAGLMGFALVGGLAVAYEMRVRKVSSLGELKGSGSVPVVGVLPWMPTEATTRDPAKRADLSEGIDKLRAYVAQTWLSRGATTVTVTSPVGDEGKSFTAFGLASSLAQAGYKTLLVDFDLRNPTLHAFAGIPNGAGVCDLLRGEADVRKSIQVLPNGLNFLPAGKWSDEARQAATGGRLESLMGRLKEPYDCVVVHSHALLTVAETVEVARRSEVVLLCALYRETRLPMVKRAAERIATMEIPYSGIVYLGATTQEALC
jgi:Mrp family chromosome partitioning ATPase/uncharacterized protein involved in exopolysaccharide biosynthesis